MNTNGMNWIRPEKRLAIYLRDGVACCYCGSGIEDGARLTLDHLTPRIKGGTHDAANLVTCCHRCNSVRGDRSVARFIGAAADYIDRNPVEIRAHIRRATRRVLDVAAAREMISRRGGFTAAVEAAAK